MNKQAYAELVVKRRTCQRCAGLTNPSQADGGRFDSDEIGPWSRWQGNLDAQIMVVGQDWGDIRYFREFEGWDGPDNSTNKTLTKILKTISITIDPPQTANGQDVLFFTNAILCPTWVSESGARVPRSPDSLTHNSIFCRDASLIPYADRCETNTTQGGDAWTSSYSDLGTRSRE